jgi:hypothetical protein
MQNAIVMNKDKIKEFFAPAQVNLPEIHHLYVAVYHEDKTARFSVCFNLPRYYLSNVFMKMDSISESYEYMTFSMGIEYDMHDLIYPEEMESEKEDSYEFVLEFMKKYNLMYKKIQKWESGDSYMGDDLSDYYVIVSKTRDSGILEKSNWDYVIKTFDEKDILIAHFNHWLVGWVEQILIKEDNYLALEKADDMLDLGVPYLDENDYYERISERAGVLAEDIKKDLRNEFRGNGKTYDEKSYYAKHMWNLDLKGRCREKIYELAERLAAEE